jgi:pyrroline-5-carboxylate reductase
MADDTLAFVGGGHMARALIGGLLAAGRDPASIRASDPLPDARRQLESSFPGIAVHADNAAAVRDAGTWVLAVKPQHMREVASGLAPLAAAARPLVVSIAAGIRIADLAAWLGPRVPIVRTMPNRPALLRCGVTALFAGESVTPSQRARAGGILGAVGGQVWLEDEALMDVVTAVSGSGPAYVFLLIEMLEAAAVAGGIDAPDARRLAVETVHGAARMAREVGEDPATLREQVTSRGGTTAAALAVLERAGIRDTFASAVRAGALRSRELSGESGN